MRKSKTTIEQDDEVRKTKNRPNSKLFKNFLSTNEKPKST